MLRTCATIVALVFAAQSLGLGGVCLCVDPGESGASEAPMAADHSCCRAVQAESDANDDETDGGGDGVSGEHAGCDCANDLAVMSDPAAMAERVDRVVATPATPVRTLFAATGFFLQQPRGPPLTGPPPLPTRLAHLQIWRC